MKIAPGPPVSAPPNTTGYSHRSEASFAALMGPSDHSSPDDADGKRRAIAFNERGLLGERITLQPGPMEAGIDRPQDPILGLEKSVMIVQAVPPAAQGAPSSSSAQLSDQSDIFVLSPLPLEKARGSTFGSSQAVAPSMARSEETSLAGAGEDQVTSGFSLRPRQVRDRTMTHLVLSGDDTALHLAAGLPFFTPQAGRAFVEAAKDLSRTYGLSLAEVRLNGAPQNSRVISKGGAHAGRTR